MTDWTAPPASVALAPGDVHAWRVRLDVDPATLARLGATLAAEERRRATAFRFARDARRFVVARAALRAVLARYLRVAPRDVSLATSPHGRPYLADGGSLEFNLSHAGDLALCAVTWDRAIGVDVEQVRADLAGERVAERVLSRREAAVLAAAPESRRAETFFDLWTRKEAYAEGLGTGLAVLDELEVVPGPAGWTLVPLAAATGFAATLAVEGKEYRLSCWELGI